MRARQRLSIILAAAAPALAALGAHACGKRESVASRSAAAFLDAQARGEEVAGEGHGHGAIEPRREPESAGVATGHPGEESAAAPGPSTHAHQDTPAPAGAGAAGGDHAGHGKQPTPGGHSGAMVHEPAGQPGQPAASGDAHAGHASGGVPPPGPLPVAASAAPGQPARTLRPDALDGAAPTSVAEAARSAALGLIPAGGHGHGGTGTYRHLDAGRHPEPAPEPTPEPESPPEPHTAHGTTGREKG